MLYLSCLVDVFGPIVKWFKTADSKSADTSSNLVGVITLEIHLAVLLFYLIFNKNFDIIYM